MKAITPDNYIIKPFRVNKTWNVNYTFLSSSADAGVFIDTAIAPPINWNMFISGANVNPSGIDKYTLYQSVQHTFYTSSNGTSASLYIPIGPLENEFYPTGSVFYVINIAQKTFGEGVKPGTFNITTSGHTGSILDDGQGHLISNTSPSGVIGNIFYNVGVIIIQQDTGSYSSSLITDRGMYLTTGSNVDIEYAGIHTIYERQIICTVDIGEFNYSTNPTMASPTLSGSMSGSVFTPQTGSSAMSLFFSGTLVPYFTTVGLYNDVNEMVAVAKVPLAIRRMATTQQTVIIRLDA